MWGAEPAAGLALLLSTRSAPRSLRGGNVCKIYLQSLNKAVFVSTFVYQTVTEWARFVIHYVGANYYTSPTSDLLTRVERASTLLALSHFPASSTDLEQFKVNIYLLSTAYNSLLQTSVHSALIASGWTGTGGNFVANTTAGNTARAAVKSASDKFIGFYTASLVDPVPTLTAGSLQTVLDRYFLSRLYTVSVGGVPESRNLADSAPVFNSFENYSDWEDS